MNIIEDIRPVTYLKTHAADVLDQINETRRPIVITQNGHARAVIQDAKSYDQMRRAIGLLKMLGQVGRDVEKGQVIRHKTLLSRLEARLMKRQ